MKTFPLCVLLSLGAGLSLPTAASAAVYVRWNQLGYAPNRSKAVIVMSDTDLAGRPWRVERIGAEGAVMSGAFGASGVGISDHTPLPFNHTADVSALREPGRYRFVTADAAPAEIRVADGLLRPLLPRPLRHLRAMRSGSEETVIRRLSHPGDARAVVHVPDGDPANGKWKPAIPARTVDALGGWYDAGDQIKFTLTIAYTTYHLLFAYERQPALFEKVLSRSDLPDVLDEARHGLEYLVKLFPDDDTFVIQVGNEQDHEQGSRLPEDDALDGKRPALCALSRVHMGGTAAALALGARIFRERGKVGDAERYAKTAAAVYARARKPGTVPTAFERGKVNDFYRDPTDVDQMALAAAELHAWTGEKAYLDQALADPPPPGTEVGWEQWNWLANLRLSAHDEGARRALILEAEGYARVAGGPGRPWGVPGRYVWGSLARWIGDANAAALAPRRNESSPRRPIVDHVFDYVFGRNNWGVSFLFDEELPNTVRNIYSPAYKLLGVFPTGALSEGPGDRATHESLAHYFKRPADDPLARFDTKAAVFSDNPNDFMCQEATIGGQADLLLLLTLLSTDAPAAK